MKITATLLLMLVYSTCCFSQPPDRPLLPLAAYTLPGYHAADPATDLQLPAGLEYDRVSSVTFTNSGTLLVLHRGAQPFLEFDADGGFIRAFGEQLNLRFAHGLDVDDAGNIWVTDLFRHLVYKLDANGKVLLTLGTDGEAGMWNEAAGRRLFYQPNETAVDSAGNVYVVQGHGIDAQAGVREPRVLKFAPDGTFIKQWGGLGDGPGEFAVAHSIKIDDNDTLYIADRENQRIQLFNTDGDYLQEWTYGAMICALHLHDDGSLWLTTGFDGELAKIDMSDGSVIGSLGSPGEDIGQFGEAHFLTLDTEENVYVADVRNRRVQIYRKD